MYLSLSLNQYVRIIEHCTNITLRHSSWRCLLAFKKGCYAEDISICCLASMTLHFPTKLDAVWRMVGMIESYGAWDICGSTWYSFCICREWDEPYNTKMEVRMQSFVYSCCAMPDPPGWCSELKCSVRVALWLIIFYRFRDLTWRVVRGSSDTVPKLGSYHIYHQYQVQILT